jgi:hypothetical protein
MLATPRVCDGKRLIYLIRDQPRGPEPLMLSVLLLLAKTYDGTMRPDYSRLTDSELVAAFRLDRCGRGCERVVVEAR